MRKEFIQSSIKEKKDIIKKMNNYLDSPMENTEKECKVREEIIYDRARLEAEILHLEDELIDYTKTIVR